ncbi:MAG TPA: alpha/beta hydrolase, partial [Bacteroidales bacterium]|nr:alpha/beta hydrolase [Bacteroidales bacterium]
MIKNITYSNGKITYFDTGSGEVVILLHGYLETAEVWDDFAKALANKFRVISVNLPGHGDSFLPGNSYSMELMAAAVKAILDHEGIDKVMMTGHSMGGYVTLAFLDKYPSRLNAYCLFHSHPYPDSKEIVCNRRREIKVVERGKKDVIYPVNVPKMFADFNVAGMKEKLEKHKKIAAGINAGGIIAVLNGMIQRPSRADILKQGNIPLLFILGRHDNYIPC